MAKLNYIKAVLVKQEKTVNGWQSKLENRHVQLANDAETTFSLTYKH